MALQTVEELLSNIRSFWSVILDTVSNLYCDTGKINLEC